MQGNNAVMPKCKLRGGGFSLTKIPCLFSSSFTHSTEQEVRSGTSYIVSVKRENEKISSFVKTAS
jgi:hypothetical protein